MLRAAVATEHVCSSCLISHAFQTPLAAAWSDAFLKAITGMPLEIADLASADKQLYDKKVVYVRDGRYKEDALAIGDLELTFVDESNGEDYMAEDAATRLPGAPVELKAGGKDIGAPLASHFHSLSFLFSSSSPVRSSCAEPVGPALPAAVTEANKAEYLQLLVEHRLVGAIKEQIRAFRTGLAVFLTDEARLPRLRCSVLLHPEVALWLVGWRHRRQLTGALPYCRGSVHHPIKQSAC